MLRAPLLGTATASAGADAACCLLLLGTAELPIGSCASGVVAMGGCKAAAIGAAAASNSLHNDAHQ
jgi:hypothetical protein